MGDELGGDDDSIACHCPAMPSRPLPLSLAASLLSPAGLADVLEDQLSAFRESRRALPHWIDTAACAPAAWALIALGLEVPEDVAARGFEVLRETDRCSAATRLEIGIDCALSMMAEALRDPELASASWNARLSAWREQRAQQVAA